jgi:cold shock CspA family protein
MSKWQKGNVAWFNDSTGDGIIVSEDGKKYYVHYSSIKSTPTLKSSSRLTLKEGQSVKFQPLQANYVSQVEYLKVECN